MERRGEERRGEERRGEERRGEERRGEERRGEERSSKPATALAFNSLSLGSTLPTPQAASSRVRSMARCFPALRETSKHFQKQYLLHKRQSHTPKSPWKKNRDKDDDNDNDSDNDNDNEKDNDALRQKGLQQESDSRPFGHE